MGTRPGMLITTFIFASWVILISGTEQQLGSMEHPLKFEEPELDTWMEKIDTSVLLAADDPDDFKPEETDASDLPTCLLCVCLTGSVYCEEVDPDMTSVPALPKETAYLYARYNKIKKITAKDFGDVVTLKRIDLTGNLISEIEDGAFMKLTLLEELSIAENRLVKLPMLPPKLMSFNANHNRLKTRGVKANAFKKLSKLRNLYLAHNELEAVPVIPESVRISHSEQQCYNRYCRHLLQKQ
ncbi:osteoglycin, paralog a [Silurus meridionalis]|uniref:osteoglycin, paralog a n=1 Tax=Silurus meridionalis TaxID=175797 RepID=UPI001EEAE445|nr:osteoglycin, paralog a [Silurus meridionalis]